MHRSRYVAMQDEALHLLETPDGCSQDDFGWEEAGTVSDTADQEDDGYGLSAYAAPETRVSDEVRARIP